MYSNKLTFSSQLFIKSPMRENVYIYVCVDIYICICIYNYVFIINFPANKSQTRRKHCAWSFRRGEKKKEKEEEGTRKSHCHQREDEEPQRSLCLFHSLTRASLNTVPAEPSRKSLGPVNPSLAAIPEPSLPANQVDQAAPGQEAPRRPPP